MKSKCYQKGALTNLSTLENFTLDHCGTGLLTALKLETFCGLQDIEIVMCVPKGVLGWLDLQANCARSRSILP